MTEGRTNLFPSLQPPEKLKGEETGIHTEKDWTYVGDKDYETELDRSFGSGLWDYVEELFVANQGVFKIVSFGGGELAALFDLRERLLKLGREKKFIPAITMVDYSLTEKLGLKGVAKAGLEPLLATGEIRLHVGPLEIRDIQDAAGANIAISRFGPFFHAKTDRSMIEMIHKVVRYLGPQGKAYIHTRNFRLQGEKLDLVYTVRQMLGPNFQVEKYDSDELGQGTLSHLQISNVIEQI